MLTVTESLTTTVITDRARAPPPPLSTLRHAGFLRALAHALRHKVQLLRHAAASPHARVTRSVTARWALFRRSSELRRKRMTRSSSYWHHVAFR